MFESIKQWIGRAVRSWTMAFNTAASTVLIALPLVQLELPALVKVLPAGFYQWFSAVVVIGNLLLNIRTNLLLANLRKQAGAR